MKAVVEGSHHRRRLELPLRHAAMRRDIHPQHSWGGQEELMLAR